MSRNSDIAKILGRTEAANASNTALGTGSGGVTVYDSTGELPSTGLTSGDQAFVESAGASGQSRLYISNGSGWYNVALINATPRLTLSSEGTIALASDGTATTITMTALDSDNASANLTLSIESGGDLFKFATVSQDSSVVTITPRTEDSAVALGYDGSATLTFKASDGINQATVQNTFTLAFTIDWATASTTLTVIDGFDNNDKFGKGHSGLNTDGTYFVVGADGDDTDYGQRGVANVYYYNGSSWGLQTALAPPNADKKANLNFGSCCDIDGDGDTAVVSASNYGTYQGAVYVYTRSGTTWTYRTRLTASDGANYDQLGGDNNSRGTAISKDGTYIIAGARQDDDGGSNHGSAYIYTGSGASWSQQQRIAPSSYSGSSNQFGFAVDINNDGTYCAVSANRWGSPDVGKVFIFTRSGSTWSEQASVTASDAASADNFGWHISMNGAGDRLLVYAKYDDDNYDSSGSIYVYTRSGSTWTQTAKLVKGDPTTSGFYYDYWGKCTLNEAGDIFVTHGHGPGDTTAGAGRCYVWKDNSSGTDGTSWSLIKTLNTTVSETYGLGAHDGFTMISRDGSVIANTSGRAPNNDEQGKAYIFNVS
jgi:hypothetical protein